MTVAIEEMLSTSQAARRLGRSKVRVIQLVRAGKLPAINTPVGRLIAPSDIDKLIAARERETVATMSVADR